MDLTPNYLQQIAKKIGEALEKVARLPSGDVDRLLTIYAVLLLAKGSATSSEDVHNAWTAWMSFEDASHKALVPYDRLDEETAASDLAFVAAIREVAVTLGVPACHAER